MKNPQPILDPTTHYRIEVLGRVAVDWLQSFDENAQIIVVETNSLGNTTLLSVHTDQAGIVGLVRRLHGLGMTILQVQVVTDEMKVSEIED